MYRNSGIPGVFLNENAHSVHMIMYADDICAVNDTIGRIRSQMSVLEEFCDLYGLDVNINKTKLVVFRNGGPLRQNENVYFNGESIEVVPCYKYLGLMFSSSLSWSNAISTLRKQAEKAVIGIKILGKKCGGLPVDVAFQLFDSKVLPILCYGSEV